MPKQTEHRDNLIHTAMRLFRKQGYASTGLQQIVVESGAPKGSLYHYFPEGKEALAVAAVTHAGELMTQMLRDCAARSRTTRGFLTAYCRTMADWMAESEFRSGCPVATTLLELCPDSLAVTAAGNAVLDEWLCVIAEVLERDGHKRRAARKQAQQIIAAMEGALLLARVRRNTRPILNVASLC